MMKQYQSSPTSVMPVLVSIILHCKDNEKTLARCLDSILAQSHPNIEIIAYDFASTDTTWEIVTDYQNRFPRTITVLRIRKDYTPGALVDHLQNARGKYVMRFHPYGTLHPELVERCVRGIEEAADIAQIRVRTQRLDEQGKYAPEPALYDRSRTTSGTVHIQRLLMENPLPFSSICFFNTDILKQHSGYSNYYTELLLALKYNAAYLHDPLFSYDGGEVAKECIEKSITHYLELLLDKWRIMAQFAGHDAGPQKDLRAAVTTQFGEHLLQESCKAQAAGDNDLAGRLTHLALAIAPSAAPTHQQNSPPQTLG